MDELAAYLSLFAIAFLAATIFPAQSELVLAAMLVSGRYDSALLIAVASAGNTAGSCLNWLLGRFLHSFQSKRWSPVSAAQLARAEAWYGRWGLWSLLVSWLPVVGDALTVVAGALRVRLLLFVLLVSVAKTGRYLVLALAVRAAGSS